MPPKKKKAPKKDTLSAAEIEREYGFGRAFFKSDPELWTLLQDAIKGGWDANRFSAKLKGSKWFKTHSDIWRQNTALKFSDPTTYAERLDNSLTQIQNLAGQFGMNLSPAEARKRAEQALLLGWSPEQILDHIATDITPSASGHYGGDLTAIEQQLRKTAMANGVNVGDEQLKGWMQSVVKGDAGVDQYQQYIRDVAAKTFTAYGDQIKAGMDMADLASPYLQSMSNILEMNPAKINLFDPTIRRALSYRNDKNEAVPMSITDFEDSLRQDKRWEYTQNANDQMKGYGIALGKMWGLA